MPTYTIPAVAYAANLTSPQIMPPVTVSTVSTQIAGDRSGLCVASNTLANINTAIPYTFCLPLLSGVVGVNASKMLPIGKLNAPLRMEFFLSNNEDGIYFGATAQNATWQLVNVEFCACYVELQDDMLESHTDPSIPQYISTTSYRQASSILLAATAGEFTTLVPFRCASLNAMYVRFRNYGAAVGGANGTAAYRKSSSINPNLGSYYFRIGSAIYPNKPVSLMNNNMVGTGAEGYAELIKSFHALSSTSGNPSFTHPQYNVCAGNNGVGILGWNLSEKPGLKSSIDSHFNNFSIGLECQSFSNRNDTILSGISTLNSQVYFTGVVYGANVAGGNGGGF